MKSRTRNAGLRLIGLFMVTTALNPAQADASQHVSEGSKPLELRAGTGLSVGLNGAGLVGHTGIELLYHFSGTARGPALGTMIHGQYFSRRNVQGGGILVGPMLAWDIRIARKLRLYLSPSVSVAYGLWTFDSSKYHFLDLQLGTALRLLVNDNWEVHLRPLHFDMLVNRGVIAFYDATIGFGYNF